MVKLFRTLVPFIVADIVVISIQWFLIPMDSWQLYLLALAWQIILPFVVGKRLTELSYKTTVSVVSALVFSLVGLIWAGVAAALGYAGLDWQPYLLGVLFSTVTIGMPLQLVSAYLGTRYARHQIRISSNVISQKI